MFGRTYQDNRSTSAYNYSAYNYNVQQFLQDDPDFTEASLRYNSSEELNLFATALKCNKNLRSLVLQHIVRRATGPGARSYKSIDNECATIIAEALTINTGLRSLRVSNLMATDDIINAFVKALKVNKTLTSIEFTSIYSVNLDILILAEMNLLLERNKLIQRFSEVNNDALATLDLLVELKTKYPAIDDPVSPQPLVLAEVYRDYCTLNMCDLRPEHAIALLSRLNSYSHSMQLGVNNTLAPYLFAHVLLFPEKVQKNCFRMILWLLRNNLNDEDLSEFVSICAEGAAGALDDKARLSGSHKPDAITIDNLLTPAEVKEIENDKQITIEQLISMLAPEAQLPYQCDALVKQVAAFAHRLENNSFVNVLESELKMRFYGSSNAPCVPNQLREYLALSPSAKLTFKELTRLECILKSRVTFDERSQFHNANNKIASDIAELKTILATIDKIKHFKQPQVQLEWEQRLLMQQLTELSQNTEGRLRTELSRYLAKPYSSLFMENELRWLEGVLPLEQIISRQRYETSLRTQHNPDACANALEAMTLQRGFLLQQISKLRESTEWVWSSKISSMLKSRRLDSTDIQLTQLVQKLKEVALSCRGLQVRNHLASLYRIEDLATELKKVMNPEPTDYHFNPDKNEAINLLTTVNPVLIFKVMLLRTELEAGASSCRDLQSKNHCSASLEGTATTHSRLIDKVAELERQLHLLTESVAELRTELSVRCLSEELSAFSQTEFEKQFTQSRLKMLEEALYRRRHDVFLHPHYHSYRGVNIIDQLETAIATIEKINGYASEIELTALQARILELAKVNKRANEIDKFAAIPPTIAKIKRLQAQVNVEHALGQEHESLIKQITELSKSTQRGKGEFSLTIFTASAKTSVESMRKTYDAYLTKEPDEQFNVTSLEQLANDLQARLDFASVTSRRQYHEAEITLLGQVIQTVGRIKQIQSTGVVPVVSAASAAAAPAAVSASLAPPRAGM